MVLQLQGTITRYCRQVCQQVLGFLKSRSYGIEGSHQHQACLKCYTLDVYDPRDFFSVSFEASSIELHDDHAQYLC